MTPNSSAPKFLLYFHANFEKIGQIFIRLVMLLGVLETGCILFIFADDPKDLLPFFGDPEYFSLPFMVILRIFFYLFW